MTTPIKLSEFLERVRANLTTNEERQQSDESLRAMANDIGIITNPSLRIAASVAVDLLKSRADLAKLVAVVEILSEALKQYKGFSIQHHASFGLVTCGKTHWSSEEVEVASRALARAEELING